MSLTPKDIDKSVTFIDIEIDLDNETKCLEGAKAVASKLRPKWNMEETKYMAFQEGITNKLYGIYQKSDSDKNDVVLVRIYGHFTDLLIDRDIEKTNMVILHKKGCGGELYGTFRNGIAYEFLKGECLDEKTVREPHIARLIAQEMARLQAIDTDSVEVLDGKCINLDKSPVLFKRLRKFHDLIPDKFDDAKQNEKFTKFIKSKAELLKEIDLLEEHLTKLNTTVVWSHNDILLKNIVYNKEKERIMFIDYEYGAYSYLPYDIGNHFCEWAGIDTVDYKLYPEKEEQKQWLREYVIAKNKFEGKEEAAIDEQELEKLYVDTNKFALSAHLKWGLWAIVQARYSCIDFDYLEYAIIRLDEYFAKRDQFLAL